MNLTKREFIREAKISFKYRDMSLSEKLVFWRQMAIVIWHLYYRKEAI